MVKWVENRIPPSDCSKSMALMDVGTIAKARDFHRSFPQYSATPLARLDRLAEELSVGGIYVKDESRRFGLNSFKALGATFALASFIAKTVGRPVWELGYDALTSPEVRRELGEFTFFAATDGNHGRAVAWAAARIGQKSVIYMPKGCPRIRLENIRREGASAFITELNYDDTIRYTAELAAKAQRGVIVQDTAWEGYEDIPGWIMQGYGVMALEACEQMRELGAAPTHIALQAGVGAFAGSVQGLVCGFYGQDSPAMFVVEPSAADCHYRSALQADGGIVKVGGDMDTIMAGLACGEPNYLSWDILRNKSAYFATIEDSAAARGMRVLGAPLASDPRVISGESGAASMGFLMELLTNDSLSDLRRRAGIGRDSQILLFSTEGDTDPGNYRRVVWDGKYPNEAANEV